MKEFADVIGHRDVLTALESMYQSGNVRQALLFDGFEGIGKSHVAEKFAKALADSADIHHLQPEGKTAQHSIEALRAFAQQINLKGFGTGYCVYIIDQADKMPVAAAHSLLKVIEEPPQRVVIILITSNYRALLPTLVSRCTRLIFGALSRNELIEIVRRLVQNVHLTASDEPVVHFGRVGFTLRYLTTNAKSRMQNALALLEFPLEYSLFKRRLDLFEAQIHAFLESAGSIAAKLPGWKDLSTNVREQLLRNTQAQLQCEVQEELDFFSGALLEIAHQQSIVKRAPFIELPIRDFAEDLQRLHVLWKRGGKLNALIEALWLRWHLVS